MALEFISIFVIELVIELLLAVVEFEFEPLECEDEARLRPKRSKLSKLSGDAEGMVFVLLLIIKETQRNATQRNAMECNAMQRNGLI
eukprot:CAMPEP_0168175734 /NCGR_PEP_ID=MMETSP0139_2-20121125/7318_1 /TAXON_ID=44445 /ORGANISM="Pseudo-nitzschia australis, Strain 10249 10 AB" /LENGTH=86 /DNA_ID=CAMNT_0008094217 /DNA_START=499 /DNA_END=759 /DNA_ORIENTATION=-